ncbi:MAG: glycosyltransferase [Alphaproteobacteria bacterium]|nr:glycosyltransferase [Alphaproteobacteria bacterium]
MAPDPGERMPVFSIVIPTFRRPGRALEAVKSALAQTIEAPFELVVVDNDPDGSALATLRALADLANIPVLIVHEPVAGVASARNAGVRTARGRFIAFLDDDETAPPGWLSELARVQAATNADVVFGPVRTRLTGRPRRHPDYFEAFFARDPGHAEGAIDAVYGCGCSLIRRAALSGAEPFSVGRNETGGEDDLLFHDMRAAGRSFAWAPGAWVWETPDPSRVTLAYTLRRAFAYGQGPPMREWSRQPRNLAGSVFWMAVGAGQILVHGLEALGAFIVRAPRRAFAYRRLAEGMGKLVWFPIVKARFYGSARLAELAREERRRSRMAFSPVSRTQE